MTFKIKKIILLIAQLGLLSPAFGEDLPTENVQKNQVEDIGKNLDLPSPTQAPEEYEKARRKKLEDENLPNWAVSAGVELFPFRNADLRVPNPEAGTSNFNDVKPSLFGLGLSGERLLINTAGILSIGVSGSAYTSGAKDPFDKMRPAIWTAAPSLRYEMVYVFRQILVPVVEFDYRFLRYAYAYHSNNIRGWKTLPSGELGLMVFLNFLEPGEGGQMQANWGIKRTYLAGLYCIVRDGQKKDFNASYGTWKIALRFEF